MYDEFFSQTDALNFVGLAQGDVTIFTKTDGSYHYQGYNLTWNRIDASTVDLSSHEEFPSTNYI